MKANLMHADHDLDLVSELPPNTTALSQDLGLDILCGAMSQGDPLVFNVAKRVLVLGSTDLEAIAYRQQVLGDCLNEPSVIRRIYEMAVEAVDAEREMWGLYSGSPKSVLYRALGAGRLFVECLKRLRQLSDENSPKFSSPGLCSFFRMISAELTDDYLRAIEAHLAQLRFKAGTLVSARLGEGNTASDLVLRTRGARGWRQLVPLLNRSTSSFEISPRDEAGLRVLEDLQSRAINEVANALAQSSEHMRAFFTMLKTELAFYVGCINLHEKLMGTGGHVCFPVAVPATEVALSAEGLYDVCLALRSDEAVVANKLHADHKSLVIVTGANQGGKSTFLRSVGLAQLMMQAGMFVTATSYRANVCKGVFTHFKREEDTTMKSGKFDEELQRMSLLAGELGPACLLLCNESFSSTNEREGSEIGHEVLTAMADAGVKVVFVTHLFELANTLFAERLGNALFLRAERLADGRRTFTLVEAEPLPTSYGEDSYWRVFGARQTCRSTK